MAEIVKPLPIRQSDNGKWEVENVHGNWIKCENESDAKILSNAPIVRDESYKISPPNEQMAAKLEKTAEKLDQYNMGGEARFFRTMAEKARGKDS